MRSTDAPRPTGSRSRTRATSGSRADARSSATKKIRTTLDAARKPFDDPVGQEAAAGEADPAREPGARLVARRAGGTRRANVARIRAPAVGAVGVHRVHPSLSRLRGGRLT